LKDSEKKKRYVSHEVFQEGRRIVNRWTFTGTHSGPEYLGQQGTGKKISWSGVTINRFNEEGLLCEIHSFFDRLAMIEAHHKTEEKKEANSSEKSSKQEK
jgi:predicted ester cyclase